MITVIFVIIAIILLFIFIYRINTGENVYKFIVNNVNNVYEKYAPYSFKVVREKVKEFAIMILMITIMSIFSIKVEATTGRINSETVNIRKEPNTDSTIIDQLDKDCKVEILEQENGWYKIKVDEKNITGYVSDKLVETDDDDTTGKQDTATSTAETAEVQPTNNDDTTAEKNIETTEIDTTKVEEIETGAIKYGQDNLNKLNGTCNEINNCLEVDVEFLIKSNYVNTDEENDAGDEIITNNITGEIVNSNKVYIYLENNRVYAEYQE